MSGFVGCDRDSHQREGESRTESRKSGKRAAKLIEWDYVIDKKTQKPVGTLAAITQHTDINVTASAVKTGRSYTHLVFFMSEKTATVSNARKEKDASQNQAEADMGKRQQTRKEVARIRTCEVSCKTCSAANQAHRLSQTRLSFRCRKKSRNDSTTMKTR